MKTGISKKETAKKLESKIWEDMKNGETLALGMLYDLYIDDLFLYGLQYAHDRAYVMDCIHDLFLDLHKYRSKLAATDTVKPYLFKSLHRKINKRYRRKDFPIQSEDPGILDKLQKEHTSAYEEELIMVENAAERTSKLKTAIALLTKKQKKGLFLRFTQDRSYEDIAEIMETSIPTARTTIYRALKILRNEPFSLFLLSYSYFFH